MPTRRVVLLLASVLFTAFVIAAFSSTATASDQFQPISPDELKMKNEPQALGAPAIVLFRQVDRDDNGQTSHQDEYLRIKILTEEGRKYADVEIPFFKAQENISHVRARTIRPDGSIASFEGKPFEKSIVKAKGVKYLAKTFTLPDVQVGGIIEYSFTRDFAENLLFDSHWILSDELFTKHAKFSLKPYSGSGTSWNVRWSWQRLPPGTAQPKEGPDHIVRLEADNIPAFQTEDFMPPEDELKARVDFVYSQETFEKDLAKFWKNKGKQRNDELEHFVGKRKAMEQAVAQIVSVDDPPEIKLQKIYARVQKLRNTSFEVRKTEQEEKRAKEKDADNVEDVWKHGYGNGIDLTWLYLGLVRAAGIEAYGVWVSDRNRYFFNAGQMDPLKLNTNVVLVKTNGKEIYCDPGSAFTPFGLLPWAETGVTGLRMDKEGGSWVQTTLPESSASTIERKANLKLIADTGSVEGTLKITYTGLEASRRRLEERNDDEADRKKFLEQQVEEYIPAASEVELVNKPDWASSDTPLVAEYSLKIPGWASAAGRRALLPIGLFSATEKRLFDHTERVHPIYFDFPFQKVDDVTIELPQGWQVSSLPKPLVKDAKVVVYSSDATNNKDTVQLSRKLVVDLMIVDTKYYAALRNFFQEVRTGDEQQIVLQPATSTASK